MNGKYCIPIDEKNYLLTEVNYQGDFYNLGLNLVLSSHKMPKLINIIKTFGGIPIYYSHYEKRYIIHDEDFIDIIKNEFKNDKMKQSFLEMLGYFEKNDINKLLNSDYAKIDIKTKIDCLYSYSKVVSKNSFNKSIDEIVIDTQKANKICHDYSIGYEQDNDDSYFSFSHSDREFLYHNNEWFLKLDDIYNAKVYYIPMTLAYLKYTSDYIYDNDDTNINKHLVNSLNDETFKRIKEIYLINKKQGINLYEKLWDKLTPLIEISIEKEKLENQLGINTPVKNKKQKL